MIPTGDLVPERGGTSTGSIGQSDGVDEIMQATARDRDTKGRPVSAPRPGSAHPVTAMLAATDLQRSSDAVVAAARAVAGLTGASLHLVHVHDPAIVPRRRRARDPEAGPEAEAEVRRALDIQVRSILGGGEGPTAAAGVVTERSAHKGILARAKATGADLVVVGSHAGDLGARRLGSTADRLVRTSPVPCLVVRGEPRFPVRRAAVLTDLSAASRAGLRVALSWLPGLGMDAPGARLDVVHVADPQILALDPAEEDRLVARLYRDAARADAGERWRPGAIRPRVLWSFHPVAAVLKEMEREDYDLVVVATHGRAALPRLLVGSVTLGLLHAAPCPVLVVPPERRRRR